MTTSRLQPELLHMALLLLPPAALCSFACCCRAAEAASNEAARERCAACGVELTEVDEDEGADEGG